MKKNLFFFSFHFFFCLLYSLPIYEINVDSKIGKINPGFTQGLTIYSNTILESQGLYGQSRVVQQFISSNQLNPSISFEAPSYLFLEGLTLHKGKVYVQSWKKGFLYIFSNLNDKWKLDSLVNYKGEGWGLTSDGESLFQSDGSAYLYKRNDKFKIIKKYPILRDGIPVRNLNELEFWKGLIFINVWFSNEILIFSLFQEKLIGIIDARDLVGLEGQLSSDSVLNGIAIYNNDQLMLTGKNWKNYYIVRLVLKGNHFSIHSLNQ